MKIIVVGGSKGIGTALVEKLLTSCNVINISISIPEISQNSNLTHHNYDITQDELPDIKIANGLFYCSGSINLKPIFRLSINDFINDFEINVLGAVKVIQKYIPILKKGIKHSIVLFSTVATKLSMPYYASIAVSKSGIKGLVKSLGTELAPPFHINTITPTTTNTQLTSKLLRNKKMPESITKRNPLKKYLSPTKVANMTAFLLSKSCDSISDQIFEMDCGIVSFKM